MKDDIINCQKIQKFKILKENFPKENFPKENENKNRDSSIYQRENINNFKCKSNYFDEFDTDLRNNKKEKNPHQSKENVKKDENFGKMSNQVDIEGSDSNNKDLTSNKNKFELSFNFNFTTENESADIDYNNQSKRLDLSNYNNYKLIDKMNNDYINTNIENDKFLVIFF